MIWISSVVRHCWFGNAKGIQHVKSCFSYLGDVAYARVTPEKKIS